MDLETLKAEVETKIGMYCGYPEEPLFQAIRGLAEEGSKDAQELLDEGLVREVLSEETGYRGRWSYGMQVVYEVDGEYLSFHWQAPATEGQGGQDTDMTVEIVERKTETIEKVYYE